MGQCASCGSTRQNLDNSVPNSPSVEFTTADLFLNSSTCANKFSPDLPRTNTRKEVRLSSTLFVPNKVDDFVPNRKLSLRTEGKTSAFKQLSKLAKISGGSPRKKLKTVTFSEPIVRTFEPSSKLHIPFSIVRLTSRVKRSNPNLNLTRSKLIISTFEVNGKAFDTEDFGKKEVGMGNNTSGSRNGVPQKFSCVSNKSVKSSSFKIRSLKDSIDSSPVALPSATTTEYTKSDSCPLNLNNFNINAGTSISENGLLRLNLNVLETNRKQKQLLRDRFFSTEETDNSNSPNILTPETDMNSNYSSNIKLSSPEFQQRGSVSQPDKVKRTFQYRAPSATAPVTPVDTNSNSNIIPKLYSTSTSTIGSEASQRPLLNRRLQSVPVVGNSKIPGLRNGTNTSFNSRITNIGRCSSATPPTLVPSTTNNFTEIHRGTQEPVKKSPAFVESPNGSIHRRESAPPRCLTQRKYNNSGSLNKIFPKKTPNGIPTSTIVSPEVNTREEGRRYSLFGTNTKISPGTSGLKRPVESKPFYTIGLYQYKSPRPVSGEFTSVFQNQVINTGVVTQRKIFYQSPTAENGDRVISPTVISTMIPTKPAQPTHPSQIGLNRSATWVREKDGRIRPDKEITTETPLGLQNAGEMKTTLHNCNDSEIQYKSSDGEMPEELQCHKSSYKSSNTSSFPLEHTSSITSTSSIIGADGHCGDANMISDSEFLIDDEICDQPELTLTFKDSPLRLSRSSSGESILSCDLMLDLSLKDSVCNGEPDLTSDSAISDVSSSVPASLGRQSNNSNGHLKYSILPRRINKIDSPISSTPISRQNTKSGFSFRSSTVENQKVESTKSQTTFKIQEKKPGLQKENTTSISLNKSPSHNTKSYSRLSSSNRTASPRFDQSTNRSPEPSDKQFKGVEKPSQLVINDLTGDVLYLREQLEVLKGILVDQETIHSEKDDTIKKLRKEIEILKKKSGKVKCGDSGEGDQIEIVNEDVENENYKKKYCGEEGERKMINSTSQTDSTYKNRDLVHPHELNGRLVSFWIGRRSYSSYNSTITFAT